MWAKGLVGVVAAAVLGAWAFAARPASAAEFADGLRAYDGGDFGYAAEVWRELANEGDAEAQASLAMLYSTGMGVAYDMGAAADLYERAARQGNVNAQLNLGDLYARGAGVSRDLVAAYKWLSLAAAQGRVWAENRRREIAPRMTDAQIARAKGLVCVFTPGPPD